MTDLTPNAEAVEAARLNGADSTRNAERILTAAMPALTAQIRADVMAGLKAAALKAEGAMEAADNSADFAWQMHRRDAMRTAARYLASLPAPGGTDGIR